MVLSVIATIALLLLGIAVKAASRDWLYPGVLFCLAWAFAGFLAIGLAPEDMSSPAASLWILLNAVLVSCGTLLGTKMARSSYARRRQAGSSAANQAPASADKLRNVTLISTVVGLGYVLVLLHSQGIGISQILNPREIAKIGMEMSFNRYGGKVQLSKVEQLLLASVYLGPLLGGTLFVRRRRWKDTVVSFISLCPSFACFAVESTRSAVLYGITLFVAAYSATRIGLERPLRRIHFTRGQIVAALSTVPLLIGLILAGDAIRSGHGKAGQAGADVAGSRVKTYLCGHFAALSTLIESTNLEGQAATPGKYTLAGLYELTHPGTRQIGVTGGGIYIPSGFTNVYTYFWELILDYTAPGSLLLVLLLSIGTGFSYLKVAEGRLIWNGVLATSYAGMLFGIASLFNYNSMILAFFIYAMMCARPWKRRGEPAWAE